MIKTEILIMDSKRQKYLLIQSKLRRQHLKTLI
jgi:hypothetical protein